jgi:hypothetical protein
VAVGQQKERFIALGRNHAQELLELRLGENWVRNCMDWAFQVFAMVHVVMPAER